MNMSILTFTNIGMGISFILMSILTFTRIYILTQETVRTIAMTMK